MKILKDLLTCLNDGRPKGGITNDISQLTVEFYKFYFEEVKDHSKAGIRHVHNRKKTSCRAL